MVTYIILWNLENKNWLTLPKRYLLATLSLKVNEKKKEAKKIQNIFAIMCWEFLDGFL